MARPSGLNYKGKFHVIEKHGEYLLVIFKKNMPQNSDIVNGDYLILGCKNTRSSLYRMRAKLERDFNKWERIFDFLNNSQCSARSGHSSRL
jgi:hypothetical protein